MVKMHRKSDEYANVDVLCGLGGGIPHIYNNIRHPKQFDLENQNISNAIVDVVNSIDGEKVKVIESQLEKFEYDIEQNIVDEKSKATTEIPSYTRFIFLGFYKNAIQLVKYSLITLLSAITVVTGTNKCIDIWETNGNYTAQNTANELVSI